MAQAYISNGQLRPSMKTSEGVSTNWSSKKSRFIHPLQYEKYIYEGTLRDEIKKTVQKLCKSTIEKYGENYLRFSIKNKFSTDDLEILMDPEKKEIHFRASTTKGFDLFGRNRGRIKKLQGLLKKSLTSKSN